MNLQKTRKSRLIQGAGMGLLYLYLSTSPRWMTGALTKDGNAFARPLAIADRLGYAD